MKKWIFLIVGIALIASANLAWAADQARKLSASSKALIKSEYNIQNKKIILYDASGSNASCAHTGAFFDTILKVDRNPNIMKYYALKKFPTLKVKQGSESKAIAAYKTLAQECGPLCIVSLKNNWIYPYPPSEMHEMGIFNFLRVINEFYDK